MARCVHCGKPIADTDVCPHCEGEQPVAWMVNVVYGLIFLFIQGTVYRLVWPNTDSLLRYGIYFLITTGSAVVIWAGLKRLRRTETAEEKNHDSPTRD